MTTTDSGLTLTGDYALDPTHTRIGFAVRHAMVAKVRGAFNDVTGTGHFDADDPTKTHAEVVAQVASVDTRNPDRDNHLRTSDFFDAEHFPEIRFTTTEVAKADDATYSITGDLTIKDVTRPVTFEVEYQGAAKDPYGNTRLGFEGTATVNRKDWGLTYNAALETGGVLIADKVTLELELSAVRNAE